MPSPCRCGQAIGARIADSINCPQHGPRRRLAQLMAKRANESGRWSPGANEQDGAGPECDPDGFAVFGRFPKGWLRHILKLRLLGEVRRDDVLHICSGTLSESERWTVDIRAAARPRVQADGRSLPFRDGSFRAILLDPPYSDEYAKNLYGLENPRPSWLLREAARVVAPGGRIGILHVAVPFAPPGCRLVNVYGITTGVGFRIRALTLYVKDEAQLFETKGEASDERGARARHRSPAIHACPARLRQ